MSTILLKQKDYEELSQSIFDLNLKVMEKDKEIERLNNIINKGIEAINVYQLARANHLEERLKEVLKENEELRVELVILRNNQIIFADCKEQLQKVK